jgi:alpha-tubulin suppressor-like RCC1 family protein
MSQERICIPRILFPPPLRHLLIFLLPCLVLIHPDFVSRAGAAGGSVFAWGYNSFGECNVPAGLNDAVAVEAGNYFSMVLRANGTVVTWGDNAFGLRNVPASATNLMAIASRGFSCLALRRDGTLLSWGSEAMSLPSGATGIVAIATGGGHHLALRQDGELLAWGANNYGQSDTPPEATNVVAIAAGYTHSLILRKDGSLVAWGENLAGTTVIPPEATNIVAISCGPTFNLALRKDGRIFAWGLDWGGNLNVPTSTNNVAVAAGELPEFAIQTDGSVLAWGRNDNGALNVPPGLFPAYAVAAGNIHALGIRVTGALTWLRHPTSRTVAAGDSVLFHAPAIGQIPIHYQWRRNGIPIDGETSPTLLIPFVQGTNSGDYDLVAQNGFGAITSQLAVVTVVPAPPTITRQPKSQAAAIGSSIGLSALAKGTIPLNFQWQLNGTNLPGQTNSSLLLSNLTHADAGNYRVLVTNILGPTTSSNALVEVVQVFAWGATNAGVLNLPPGLSNVVQVAAGSSHSLALRSDGSVLGWGENYYNEAAVLSGESTWKQVAAGHQFSLGLRMNGTVAAYGNILIAPSDATNIAAIAAGPEYCLLLRSNRSLMAWGWANTPSPPASATNIIGFAAGRWHSLGVRSDGSLLAWGANNSGQLNFPPGRSNSVAVAAGDYFSVGLDTDGTVFAWGGNWAGQTNVPPAATNIVLITAKGDHAAAVRADGKIFVWGDTNSQRAVIPAGLTSPEFIAAGAQHYLALQSTGGIHFVRQPVDLNLIAGQRTFLHAAAVGSGPINYQWTLNGTNLVGATNAQLIVTESQAPDDGGYALIVSNGLTTITSAVATVTISPSAPIILTQPAGRVALPGTTVLFNPSFLGTAPISFQWTYNGTNLPNATNRSLLLPDLQLHQAGLYQVVLSNALGSVTSAVAQLEVYPINLVAALTNASGTRSADWGDFDNDGLLDLLLGGVPGAQPVSTTARLFRNLGEGNFAEVNAGFAFSAQSVAWADFDNDGFLDALLVGASSARIARNQGDGTFTNLTQNLSPGSNANGVNVDFDNDGLQDVALGHRLYRNAGGNVFTFVNAGLPTFQSAIATWADYDRDGWSDVLLCGLQSGNAQFRLFRNLGNNTFTNVPAGFQDFYRGMGAWFDFNADGWLDLVANGETGPGVRVTSVYRNNGDGSFTALPSNLQAARNSFLAVADGDNDGQPDLMLNGHNGTNFINRLYRGETNGSFTALAYPLPTNLLSGVSWGDYDRDGRLDLALAAVVSNITSISVFRNDHLRTNTPPTPPSGTTSLVGPSHLRFQWSPGNDLETPTGALTYALRVGRTPGGGEVLAPMAKTNGVRRVARPGNAESLTTLTLTNIPFGRYYWAVQTVDAGLEGSSFTTEQVVDFLAATLSASNITSTSAWLNAILATNALPAGVFFEWGNTTNYGSQTAVQILNTNAPALITNILTGLTPGTTYQFRVVLTNATGSYPGGNVSFTTADVPQITLQPVSSITATGATLNVLVNPNRGATTVRFEYGLSPAYGSVTSFTNIGNGSAPVPVARRITGLIGGQVYHYRIVATNFVGASASADQTFTTTSEPELSTQLASAIGPVSAQLNGLVRPNTLPTTAWFEYGNSTNYDSTSAMVNLDSGTDLLPVAITVSNLSRATTHHFRIVASNSFGVTFGANRSFITTNDVIALLPTGIGMTNAILNGLVNPNGLPTTVVFQYGATTNFTTTSAAIPLAGETQLLQVSLPVGSLQPGSNYVYRLVATNSDGVRFSGNMMFQALPQFTILTPALAGSINGGMVFGDFNRDQHMDMLVSDSASTRLYQNAGNGSFSNLLTGIPGCSSPVMACQDFNRDGLLDIAISGTIGATPITRVYFGLGTNLFTDANAGLPAIHFRSLVAGDFNHDGTADLLLAGETNSVGVTLLYTNHNGAFTNMPAGLPTYLDATASAADFDNDGWLDIFLAGRVGIPYANVFAVLLRNEGNGSFSMTTNGLDGVRLGFSDWGDVDSDGDIDLVYGGMGTGLGDILRLYRNDGSGAFTNATGALPNFACDAAQFGDFDNNGLPDLLIRGQKYISSQVPTHSYSAVLYNQGNATFTTERFALPELWSTCGGWFDYDSDGKLDAVVSGNSRTGAKLLLYRNNNSWSNSAPTIPANLQTEISGSQASLTWTKSSDAQSPENALTYNVRLGTAPATGNLLSPLSALSGTREVIAQGNVGFPLGLSFTNLAPGFYFWSVQSVDHAFTGSPFAAEVSFVITGAPTVTTLSASNLTLSSVTLRGSFGANGQATSTWFDWGLSTNLGSVLPTETLANNANGSIVTALLSGLEPGRTYYFRAAASNSLGSTFGQMHWVQSAAIPGLIKVSVTTSNSLTLQFSGTSGFTYRVLSSTNLFTWELAGFASDTGTNVFRFTLPTTNAPVKFYRAVLP